MSGRLIIPPALRPDDVLLVDGDKTYRPGPVMIEAIRAAREGRPIPGEDDLSDLDVRLLNAMFRLAVNAPGNRAARRQAASRRRGRR